MPKGFIHLHGHSAYSLLDGAGRIPDLVKQAAEYEMPAVALTDHGVLYGALEFYEECKKAGIKPILGCEVYVAPRTRFDRDPRKDAEQYHLVLLAQNEEGWRNLMQLVSLGYLEGFYYKPRVDHELLAKYNKGLICLSACLGAEIPQHILRDNLRKAKETIGFYKEVFGDRYYLEIQDHGIAEQKKVNEAIKRFAKEFGIPLVVTNDFHYIRKEDADLHDILLCIQTNSSRDDPKRMRFHAPEFYFKSSEEITQQFSDLPEALAHTLDIADRCQLELDLGKTILPHYEVPEGHTYDTYLREQCLSAIPRLYPHAGPEVYRRLDYELKVISDKGFSAYFLIVQDFAHFAKSRGILARARGSAAGSLVSYLLGLTNIDPLKHGLLFERFLVPERITPPDIDMDFTDTRREEVLEYVRRKYGEDHVAQIITFGTMAARAAVRDAGRVMGFPASRVDQIAKLIPFGVDIDTALETVSDLREIADRDPQVKSLLETAKGLVGLPRHASVHAAGVVIAPEPLTHFVPLQKMNDGTIVTQFDMNNVAKVGLLKMDFLGLAYLSVVENSLRLIRETTGKEINIDSIPFDDEKTYRLLQRGDTAGVFQLESDGMRRLLQDLKPTEFEDIIAVAALYRPGPLQNGDTQEYVRRKHGLSPVTYFDPSVEPILKPILRRTYGILVYQEQVMQIASELAGFRPAQADDLRRAMSKKDSAKMEKLRIEFLEGAKRKGVREEVAQQIFDAMYNFSSYAFSLNHSAAYAVLAYQTAWLKANYPAQYLAAKMTAEMDNKEKVAFYVEECRRMGISVLPPDINRSLMDFTVEEGKVRFGLAAIKGLGRSAIEAILEARKDGAFTSLADFCTRVDPSVVTRSTLEALIGCGAFDHLHPCRRALMEAIETAINLAQRTHRERSAGQTSLFGLVSEGVIPDLVLPEVPEFEQQEKLSLEKDLLGLYLSDHPLRHVQEKLKPYKPVLAADLKDIPDKQTVTVAGIVTQFKRSVSKSSGRTWMLLNLEDLTGSVTVTLYSEAFERYGKLVEKDKILVIRGKTNYRDRVRSEEEESVMVEVMGEEVIPIDRNGEETLGEEIFPSEGNGAKIIHFHLPQKDTLRVARSLRQLLDRYPGSIPVVVHRNGDQIRSRLRVSYCQELLEQAVELLGGEGIFIER